MSMKWVFQFGHSPRCAPKFCPTLIRAPAETLDSVLWRCKCTCLAVTAVSNSLPSAIPTPPAVRVDAAPVAESEFEGQLRDLLGGLSVKTDDAPQAGVSEEKSRGKKEEAALSPTVIVAILTTMLYVPEPAGFGAPSAGDEAGPAPQAATAIETDHPVSPEPASLVTVSIEALSLDGPAPVPPAEAELAFALRLVDLTPDRKPLLIVNTVPPAQTQPAAAQKPAVVTDAAPAIQAAPSPDAAKMDSGSFTPDSQQPSQDSPKPERPRVVDRETVSSPASGTGAPRETPLPTAGPTPTATVSTATASRAPEPSVSSATVAAPAEHVPAAAAAVRPSASSEVTDISLTLPVQRAGDERVAIRMVQRGTEIHVSVRTPDVDAARSMRQDLSRLSSSLDDAGFRADSWRPTTSAVTASSPAQTMREFSQETPNRDTPGSGEHAGGNQGQSSQEQKRRQQDERPRWVAELERQRNR